MICMKSHLGVIFEWVLKSKKWFLLPCLPAGFQVLILTQILPPNIVSKPFTMESPNPVPPWVIFFIMR